MELLYVGTVLIIIIIIIIIKEVPISEDLKAGDFTSESASSYQTTPPLEMATPSHYINLLFRPISFFSMEEKLTTSLW